MQVGGFTLISWQPRAEIWLIERRDAQEQAGEKELEVGGYGDHCPSLSRPKIVVVVIFFVVDDDVVVRKVKVMRGPGAVVDV